FKSRVHDSTQRSGEPFQGTNRNRRRRFAHSPHRETIGSPARRDAVEFSSDFQQGEVVAGLPGRTIQDDTSLLGTPQPVDARDLISSGKRKVPRETGTQPASPYMGRCTGLTGGCVSVGSPLEEL